MASPEQQQAWVPYETAKDCSQGFCSIYCPQWCYVFPPPPPFSFVGDESSGSKAFSPLVIAVIGILASAFLLVSYYTIISKYCGGFRRRPLGAHGNPDDPVVEDDDIPAAGDGSRLHDNTWHLPPSTGLDEALISKITVYKYRRGEGLVDGQTDCSVCLGEFRENESLRLLPKCSHAFHLRCIDTWLRSHSNCPLCRANIMSECVETERERNDETVVAIEDINDEENNSEIDADCDFSKENNSEDIIIEIKDDEGADQQLMRRSFSVNCVSIGDVLKLSMEDELMAAKSLSSGYVGGSSSRNGGENRKESGRSITRSLHCVMSPVPMKRSVSSGRLGFARHEKGRNSALPI